MLESREYADALHLNEKSDDEAVNNARSLALRYLSSGAPIPQTLLTKVERAARSAGTEHTP